MNALELAELETWQGELERAAHFGRKDGCSDAGYPTPLGRHTDASRDAERKAALIAKVLRELKAT